MALDTYLEANTNTEMIDLLTHVNMSSYKITTLGSPTDLYDAATKKYVDDAVFTGVGGFFVFAHDFSGTYWDDKIRAAMAYVYATFPLGATIDSRGVYGSQECRTQLDVGNDTTPILIQTGHLDLDQSAPIIIHKMSAITGVFSGTTDSRIKSPSHFRMKNGANLEKLIHIISASGGIKNITVDGNYTNNPSGGDNIWLTNRWNLVVNVQNIDACRYGSWIKPLIYRVNITSDVSGSIVNLISGDTGAGMLSSDTFCPDITDWVNFNATWGELGSQNLVQIDHIVSPTQLILTTNVANHSNIRFDVLAPAAASHIILGLTTGARSTGIFVDRNSDCYVTLHQAENNNGIGVNLSSAAACRWQGGDIGGNGYNSGGAVLPGLKITSKNGDWYNGHGCIIEGLQLGSNWGNQIEIDGWDSTLTVPNYVCAGHKISCYIVSPSGSPDTVSAIKITDGLGNTIDANIFSNYVRFNYGFEFVETASFRGLGDRISGSIIGAKTPYNKLGNTPIVVGMVRSNNGLYFATHRKIMLENQDYLFTTDQYDNYQYTLGTNPDGSVSLIGATGVGEVRLQSDIFNVQAKILNAGTYIQAGKNLNLSSTSFLARETAVVSGLTTGQNADVNIGNASTVYINNDPGGSFTISGFTGGVDGRELTVISLQGRQCTFMHNTTGGNTSSGVNQISLFNGTDFTVTNLYFMAKFLYVGALNIWLMTGYFDGKHLT